ncbi:uncharacterized protein TM35_000321200 [Trypanosoma theileri]|uniref:Uncharacterized protein n=1 Tax=Trypanosoma theileri TaxID=67003 RepID=A0A1X0NM58_9TRYP|nr:uncharacterized protein TM35_000321200 [Trypanosoma theileri]ORC85805.1 hypothetical protein TM35_000321200 [Trypanosoma theileri]
MGPRSAVRNVAAITIQRWYRRRLEVTRAIRLLAILHILHHERNKTAKIAPILFEITTAYVDSVNDNHREDHSMSGDGGDGVHLIDFLENSTTSRGKPLFRLVELLLSLAVRYGERLHHLHTEKNRQYQCKQYQYKQQQGCCPQRLLLLTDTMLVELLLDIRRAGDVKQHEPAEKPKEEPQRVVWCLRHCLDAAGISWFVEMSRRVEIEKNIQRTSPLYYSFIRTFQNTRVTQLLLPCVCDDSVVLADVPPLPQPPSLWTAPFLPTAETSHVHSQKNNNNNNNSKNEIQPQKEKDDEDEDDDDDDSIVNENDEEEEEDEDEDYDDDKYYNRQHAREQARLSRILSALQMEEPSVEEKEKNDKNKAERRSEEETAAQDSYMQLFGEVKEVLFPTLNTMKIPTSACKNTKTTTNKKDLDSRFCVVCELSGIEDELVVCCCGNCIHRDCTHTSMNGEWRCSRFCQPL